MFTIVTHYSPDLDAIASVWLIKRFLPNWQDAQVRFVPAGKTLDGQIVDNDPNILHVDTGMGFLDHHHTNEYICAAKKVYKLILNKINNGNQNKTQLWEDESLMRMCDVITFYDHFGEARLPDASADYHVFDAVSIINGLKSLYPDDDHKIMDIGLILLDSIYKQMQEKVWAEKILESDAQYFETKWGKGLGVITINDEVLEVAQKKGTVVVVRKDPHKNYVRIKGSPGTAVDLTEAYGKLKEKDPDATWFLHASKKILLNGTTKNPDMRPTKLSLEEIIEVLKHNNS